jgi:predicted AAA+ superfamily ATPase
MRIRYLDPFIRHDLKEKMVFLAGPRQAGKTTLAQTIGRDLDPHCTYLNWDDREDRERIRLLRFPTPSSFLIFDELHKLRGWKNHVKGLFDKHRDHYRILVTGSARMDIYRRGGDSLMGRYHHLRLHPFSLGEILRGGAPPAPQNIVPFQQLRFPSAPPGPWDQNVGRLLRFGGFPEPWTKQDEVFARRWRNDRLDRLVQEDIRDVEWVRDLSKIELLADLLPGKVGGLFSLNSLREDLEVAHKTAAHWVDILERFYHHFRIYPYSRNTIKSLRREPKLYLWDWSPLADEGARLENMVACHLLKLVHFLHDTQGHRAELAFLRDVEEREVDFLVTVDKKPWFAVEVKRSSRDVSKHLLYFAPRLNIPYLFQVIGEGGVDETDGAVRILSADTFLAGLP